MSLATGYGLSCPQGGQFYICQGNTTQFLGCCEQDPCADGSGNCPAASLRTASYNRDDYDNIPPQSCASSDEDADWYTCSATDPPFLGCCSSNACQADDNAGCPDDDLMAAALASDADDAAPFMTSTTTATATSTSSTATGSSSSVATAGDDDDNSLSTGTIVGISVGSVLAAILAAVIGIILCRRRRKRTKHQKQMSAVPLNAGTVIDSPGLFAPSPYRDSFGGFPSPPSSYQGHAGGGYHEGDKQLNGTLLVPGQASPDPQRPLSSSYAPSWFSGNNTTSPHHSVSSMGSNGALNIMLHNQQQRPQQLNTVSEMDGTDVPRPVVELAGSPPPPEASSGSHNHASTHGAG